MNTHEIPGFTILPQHRHRPLERSITEVAPGVHVFVGYGTSVFSAIIGTDGYILVDTGDSLSGAEAALRAIRERTPLPLKAVILTHSHPDHRSGGNVFLADQGEVPVWGRPNFGAEQAGFKGLERISALRGGRQFGRNIPDAQYTPNRVLPRMPEAGAPGPLIAPTVFMAEPRHTLRIAGVELELHAAPGETSDHLNVWLPKEQVMFSGDAMYRSFPNLYPIRGAGFRDVAGWAAAVRRIMEFNPRVVVMGHMEPAAGGEAMTMLARYSEAIEYVYTETLKGMDAGLTPDELAVSVRLPEHLRGEEYLGEYYGCVPWAVRSIFSGLLGWFDGNPSTLVPLAPTEEAQRMARLAGGTAALVTAARKALYDKDYRWAARLADYALRLEETREVKLLKADALEALSSLILPISGKNYLLSSAIALREE